MKKLIIIVIAAISFTALKAQQIPLYTQYYNNEFLYNPSQTLTDDYSSLSLFYRKQWILSESPLVTQGVVFQTPLKTEKVGLGVNLINDKFGIFNRTGASMAYSYQVDLNADHKLLLGLSAGFMNTNYDWNQDVSILSDPRFQEAITDRVTSFDATFGFTYKWKELEVGVAIPHLLADDLDFTVESSDLLYFNYRHYVASAAYQFRFGDDKYGLRPLALVRYQPAVNPLFDINAVFDYNQKVWAAVGYRYEGAMTFGAGVKLHDRFNIGYSYDMNLNSDLTQYFGATHEINLSVNFGASSSFGGGTKDKKRPDCLEFENEDGIMTEICLEDLQKEISDLKKANADQDSTIEDHEERIKRLENKVRKDSLEEIMKGILNDMKVGSGYMDIKGDNLEMTGTPNPILNPNDKDGNVWGYHEDGTPIKPFEKIKSGESVYTDPNAENIVADPKAGVTLYDENGNEIKDLSNYTGRVKDVDGNYVKGPDGKYLYYNNEGYNDNYNNGGGGNNGGGTYNGGGNKGRNNNGGGDATGGNNNGGSNNNGNSGRGNGNNNSGRSPVKTYSPTELMDDGIRYTAPGNYVVVGSYRSKEYAIAMRETLQDKGYSAGIVYNHFRKWFYVYTHESNDFDKTLQLLRQEQTGDYSDAWVHVIIE
ncbi:MAG: PorP/SprF family type IX secretion system membrane protein [Bacteroidia bacterium]